MGARGPKPKPAAINELQGNPGKRQAKGNIKFELSEASEKPPTFLGKYARQEWRRIFPLLKKNHLVTDGDIMALAAYCQAVDTLIVAEKAKRSHGLVDVTDKGNVVQRPEVGIANHAMDQILKFGREFGLTPSARASFDVGEYEESDNPVLTLISRAKELRA